MRVAVGESVARVVRALAEAVLVQRRQVVHRVPYEEEGRVGIELALQSPQALHWTLLVESPDRHLRDDNGRRISGLIGGSAVWRRRRRVKVLSYDDVLCARRDAIGVDCHVEHRYNLSRLSEDRHEVRAAAALEAVDENTKLSRRPFWPVLVRSLLPRRANWNYFRACARLSR